MVVCTFVSYGEIFRRVPQLIEEDAGSFKMPGGFSARLLQFISARASASRILAAPIFSAELVLRL
jgi:hypothetical protein